VIYYQVSTVNYFNAQKQTKKERNDTNMNHQPILNFFCEGVSCEICLNPEIKPFHLRTKILKENTRIFDPTSLDDDTHTPIMTKTLIKKLQKVLGVNGVSVFPYEIIIEKAKKYAWDEMDEQIKKIFAMYLPAYKSYETLLNDQE